MAATRRTTVLLLAAAACAAVFLPAVRLHAYRTAPRAAQPSADGGGCTASAGGSLMRAGDASDCRLPELGRLALSSCVGGGVTEYLSQHVLVAVNTGGGLLRMDLSLCTWLHHVPADSLYIFSDGRIGDGGGRKGVWVNASDDVVVPSDLVFTAAQQRQRGYHISWRRAQFRFLYAIRYIIEEDRRRQLSKRWFVLVDDDTFVSVHALVAALRSYDGRNAPRGRYVGDLGWGGAGHVFDRRAAASLLRGMKSKCIEPYMVRGSLASDEALSKCVPAMGIRMVKDPVLSHCHGAVLRERLLTGTHVSMHLKRDVSAPPLLAMWRYRLYYQVVYHRNITAYALLQRVGNCGYGSCASQGCDEGHDRRAVETFLEVSGGGTFLPSL
eukprot:TRINITY_DN30804_c0_g1_i1.p1 TRINITY_DN30804_c0_g1~~TRINITY_DN30804_c0_g1_i1.p1  ORF type:complete len:415 (+),score=105.35 TRINITY_DN30804_c0_g1_i1:97-1245(+)